jgi:hypothetical protein
MRIGLAARPPAATSPGSGRSLPRLLAVLAAASALVVSTSGPAAAELPKGVVWTATIDDQNVDRLADGGSVRLDPARPVEVAVRIENGGQQPVSVPFVRLEGGVLGLEFYAYTTQVDLELQPGESATREFPVRMLGLAEQASGLLPSQIALVDLDNRVIEAKGMPADIRGDADSVYSLFGMAVGALALLLLAGVLWRLATGRLSQNRWRRGLAMAAPGLGLGFLLTFTLSAFRWASPEPGLWTTLLLGSAVVGFVAGYLSPTPGGEDEAPFEDAGAGAVPEPRSPTPAEEEPLETEPNFVVQLDPRADEVDDPMRSHRWRS